jgi:hypothetical protein
MTGSIIKSKDAMIKPAIIPIPTILKNHCRETVSSDLGVVLSLLKMIFVIVNEQYKKIDQTSGMTYGTLPKNFGPKRVLYWHVTPTHPPNPNASVYS